MSAEYVALVMLVAPGFAWGISTIGTRWRQNWAEWPEYWLAALSVAVATPVAAFALTNVVAPSPLSVDFVSFIAHPVMLGDLPTSTSAPALFDLSQLLVWVYAGGLTWRLILLARRLFEIHVIKCAASFWKSLDDVPVCVSSSSKFTFAMGLWRPRIIVSESQSAAFDDDQMRLVLRHEMAHLRRRDPAVLFLLELVRVVYWWVPFIHHLIARWYAAAELACDAQAIANEPTKIRRRYAHALLRALVESADRSGQYPAATFSSHTLRNEKMRILNILNGSSPNQKRANHYWLIALSSAALVATGSVALAQPKSKIFDGTAGINISAIVDGRKTSDYGPAHDPSDQVLTLHTGIDIGAPAGTPIYTPYDATVVSASNNDDGESAWGNVVKLNIGNDTQLVFAHLQTLEVAAGDRVRAGDLIARVGQTGKATRPHVHIETYVAGERVSPNSLLTTASARGCTKSDSPWCR